MGTTEVYDAIGKTESERLTDLSKILIKAHTIEWLINGKTVSTWMKYFVVIYQGRNSVNRRDDAVGILQSKRSYLKNQEQTN